MRWRSIFSRQKQKDSEAVEALSKLLTGGALYNRAVINGPGTLRLYRKMFEDPSDMRLFGKRSFELISLLAQREGKPAPDSMETAVAFLNEELKRFDTPEATELRDKLLLIELKRLLGG